MHELGRRGLSDREQLRFAAADHRVFVTRNRDDYISLTVEAFQAGAPHAGVLILPHTVSNQHPALIARAIERWDKDHRYPEEALAYLIDFAT